MGDREWRADLVHTIAVGARLGLMAAFFLASLRWHLLPPHNHALGVAFLALAAFFLAVHLAARD